MAKVSEEVKNQIVTIIRKDLEDIVNTDTVRTIKDYQALVEEITDIKLTPAGVGHFVSIASNNMRDNDSPIRLVRFTNNSKICYKTVKVVYSHFEKRRSVACIVIDDTEEVIEIYDYNKPYDEKYINTIYHRFPGNACQVNYENSSSIPLSIFLAHLFNSDEVVPEWLFSYPELLSKAIDRRVWWNNVTKTIDKGDISLAKILTGYNEGTVYVEDLLYRIELVQLIKKITNSNDLRILKENYRLIRENFSLIDNNLNLLPRFFHLFMTVGRKIAVNTAKNFKNLRIDALFDLFITACKFDALSVLDENRDYDYNYKLVDDFISVKKNEVLAKKLTRLNFLHHKIIGGYEIIVPQSLKDLQNEGKAQNNCVGYYYNDSIIDGKNLIYFIREKENPTKSFVTCRYSLGNKKTVEYRTKNNRGYTNRTLIDTIDTFINNNII